MVSKITLHKLINPFEDKHFELLRDILARIGLADVREFGLSWDDCYDYLHRLGYDIKVEVSEVP